MRVRQVMSVNPVTCSVEDPLGKAARLMRDRGVGFVVCLAGERVAGILTDRDIAVRAFAEGSTEDRACRDVMTPNPALVHQSETVFAVLDTMRSAGMVRRVPVVDDAGLLVGVVSLSDLAGVAKDILMGILDEELSNATRKARALTGAKRIGKRIRRPTKADRLPEAAITRKRGPSREGQVRYPTPRTRFRARGRQSERRARSHGRAGRRTADRQRVTTQ